MDISKEVNDTGDDWPSVLKIKALRAKTLADMGIVRLSVLLNQGTARALKDIAKESNISYTETIRRAVSVASFLYAESRAGRKIVVSDKHGRELKEIILE